MNLTRALSHAERESCTQWNAVAVVRPTLLESHSFRPSSFHSPCMSTKWALDSFVCCRCKSEFAAHDKDGSQFPPSHSTTHPGPPPKKKLSRKRKHLSSILVIILCSSMTYCRTAVLHLEVLCCRLWSSGCVASVVIICVLILCLRCLTSVAEQFWVLNRVLNLALGDSENWTRTSRTQSENHTTRPNALVASLTNTVRLDRMPLLHRWQILLDFLCFCLCFCSIFGLLCMLQIRCRTCSWNIVVLSP